MIRTKNKRRMLIIVLLAAIVLGGALWTGRSISRAYAYDDTAYGYASQSGDYISKEVAATYDYTVIDAENRFVSVRITNKTVATKATIPSKTTIGDIEYTVTEIATNGFGSSTQLKRVTLAKTIKKIGNSAFSNCKQLTHVYLSNVETIGNYAFMRCSALERIVIPSTVTNLGTAVFRTNTTAVEVRAESAASGWSETWNSNNSGEVTYASQYFETAVYEPLYTPTATQGAYSTLSETDNVVGYAYADGQPYAENFYNNNENIEVIPAVNPDDGLPILEIDQFSYEGVEVDKIIVEYSTLPINVKNYAFSGCICPLIIVNRNVTLNDSDSDDGQSEGVFLLAETETILLPRDIDGLPNLTFADSLVQNIGFITPQQRESYTNLTAELPVGVDLPTVGNTFFIGDAAFDNAQNIPQLTLHMNIATIGDAVFANWMATQTIIIDGTYYNGVLINKPDGWSATYLDACNANVRYGTYRVELDYDGGTGNAQYIDCAYGALNVLTEAPTKFGYKFEGYFTAPKKQGVKYYDRRLTCLKAFDNVDVTKLYAGWTKKEINVNFDYAGGTGYSDGFTREYSDPLPDDIAAPEKQYYIFDGFFDAAGGQGVQYYDAEMRALRNCDKDGDFTLYAYWVPIDYTITYTNCRGENTNPTTLNMDEILAAGGTYTFAKIFDKGYATVWTPASVNSTSLDNMTVTGQLVYRSLSDSLNGEYYEIWNRGQFAELKTVGNDVMSENYKYKLMADIDFLAADDLYPAKTDASEYYVPQFRGYLYGNRKTVKGFVLDIKSTAVSGLNVLANVYPGGMGLVGVNSGTIEALTVQGYIKVEADTGLNLGMLCGYNSGAIINCVTSVYGNNTYGIDSSNKNVGAYIGGVVGYNCGRIENCINQASLRASGNVGGIAGYSGNASTAAIYLSRNSGKIDYAYRSGLHAIGGIVGVFETGEVIGCTDYAKITFVSDTVVIGVKTYIGLIIGKKIASDGGPTHSSNTWTYGSRDVSKLRDTSNCGDEVGGVVLGLNV